MRGEHLLISLLGLIFGFFLIAGGIVLFLLPIVPALERALLTLFEQNLRGFSYLGLSLFFLGVLFLTLLSWLNRRRYLMLKMEGVFVKDKLVAELAKESLSQLYPGKKIECTAIIRKKKRIEILANLPFIEEEERESALLKIEEELARVFFQQCQYSRSFILNVSFSPPH